MSTAADNLLDGIMTAAEDGQPTDDRIILSVDEPSRTINYDGNLILGVKGDRFAERIYFRCPQYVYKDVSEFIDLEKPTTKIKINYKNAYNEPYIEECTKHGLENGEFIFSWFISDWATVKDGVVTFNVCVIDESETLKDQNGNTIVQEWHTTTFKGTILPAIDVSDVTPEVYTSETKTSAAIVDEIKTLEGIVKEYEDLVDNKVADAMYGYSDTTTASLYESFEAFKVEAEEDINAAITSMTDNFEAYKESHNVETQEYINRELDNYIPRTIIQYSTNMENGEDLYDSEYPLLISDYDGYIADVTSAQVLTSPSVLINPVHGVIIANSFREDGMVLSDKYALKDQVQNKLKEHELKMNADGDSSNTNDLARITYTFNLEHDDIVKIIPNAKYIYIYDIGVSGYYYKHGFTVKGFTREGNSSTNFSMSISGSQYVDANFNEFSINIICKQTGANTYENTLVMQVPSDVNSIHAGQFLPQLYNSQDIGYHAKLVILYED